MYVKMSDFSDEKVSASQDENDGSLNIRIESMYICIDREDILRSPVDFEYIARYIETTLQDASK